MTRDNTQEGNTMTEYNEGDLVEAVKGETVIRGRLKADSLGHHLWVGDSGRTPENIESYGFTISVVEKAAAVVVLPKGVLLFDDGHVARWHEEILGWSITGYRRAWGDPDEILRNFGSDFTILEPVSETAKKVLDRVNGWWARDEHRGLPIFLSAVRLEFGVTS